MRVILQQFNSGLKGLPPIKSEEPAAPAGVCRDKSYALLSCPRLLAVILLHACLVVAATAQLKFVQLTDPHFFDKSGKEASSNREVLLDAIREINILHRTNHYDFVVVTGDIGVEQILDSDKDINKAIGEGAEQMGNVLAASDVKVWLFVPGNNDLKDENPATIEHYHAFIEALGKNLVPEKLRIFDLCGSSQDVPYVVNDDYVIVGFNNASFKNNNDGCRVDWRPENECRQPTQKEGETPVPSPESLAKLQRDEIQKVGISIAKTGKYAYIFYHIPEVDDPYLLKKTPPDRKRYNFLRTRELNPTITEGDLHKYSSWFVNPTVWNEWKKVTDLPKVKGLFAGHLHEPKMQLYESNRDKLYVCPPLAIKFQVTAPQQARGFCEISIDEGKDRGSREGNITRREIYWYIQETWMFSDTPTLIANPSPNPLITEEPMTWQTRASISTTLQFFVAILQFLLVAISVYLIWKQLKKQGEQLKRQTELARFANTQALVNLSSPFNLEMAKSREMAELWALGQEDWEDLDEGKRQQHESMLRWWFIFYENIFFQFERGLLDEKIFLAWKKDMDVFVEEQFVEKYWSRLRQKYHKEFVDYLDDRIKLKEKSQQIRDEESPSSPPVW